jgi:signal peptidase I
MTAAPAAPEQIMTTAVRRLAHRVLTFAVRGKHERGGDWGEALLAEFAETRGDWEAVRWAASGLRAVWHERRQKAKLLPRRVRIGRRVALIAVVGLLGGLVADRFVLSTGFVASGSMEPTLLVGDRYLELKAFYTVSRGDLVVIGPHDGYSEAVKRVIGLPGDTVSCRDGQVWVNGARLDEPYLAADFAPRTDCTDVTVPPGRLYVLGDHREVSQDSRQIGPIRRAQVKARVLGRLWPIQHRVGGVPLL